MWYKNETIYMHHYEIRQAMPNTSLPSILDDTIIASLGFEIIFETPAPTVGELQIAYQDGTEIDSKGNRVIKWSVKDMFEDTPEKTKAEQEDEYMAKKMQDLAKAMENAIENHINTTVKARGYNSQDSIAKYLVSGNPFYARLYY